MRKVALAQETRAGSMRYHAGADAARLDRWLGDPEDDGRIFSYARCAGLDDGEEFPLEICRELDVFGLPRHYVPAEYGGALRYYDGLLQLLRVIARRDLTVAIAHGKTFLGAVCVWVGGDAEQARHLGAEITKGAVVSWALTERDHGSDLMAGEVSAQRTREGYRLTGEKWLINNATRCHLMSVLARTAQPGGPRGFSVLLVDRRILDRTSHHPLPAVRLHGIRGADISGIAFRDAPVTPSALVGAEGSGLETVLKSLQLTRTLCASLSLGAADQALDMAVRYASDCSDFGRPLSGRSLDRSGDEILAGARPSQGETEMELPQTRRVLCQSYGDLLLAEAVSLVAVRAIHGLTEELSVSSAIVKYFVPTLVHRMLSRLATVIGPRSQLVGSAYEHGRFQKVQRDHRIVGIFDGSTVVNLHSLVNQFSCLVRGYQQARVDQGGLRWAAELSEPPPDFDRDRLQLVSRHGSSLVQSLPAAAGELRDLAASRQAPASIGELAGRLHAAADQVIERMAAHRPIATDAPVAALALAQGYAACFAGAAAIQLWLRNRPPRKGPEADGLWASGLWLETCLSRALSLLDPSACAETTGDVTDRLAATLLARHAPGRLPSPLSYPPADSTP
jgi:alkylation response protein AidB-like acyl-CoA dehydrogenase